MPSRPGRARQGMAWLADCSQRHRQTAARSSTVIDMASADSHRASASNLAVDWSRLMHHSPWITAVHIAGSNFHRGSRQTSTDVVRIELLAQLHSVSSTCTRIYRDDIAGNMALGFLSNFGDPSFRFCESTVNNMPVPIYMHNRNPLLNTFNRKSMTSLSDSVSQ